MSRIRVELWWLEGTSPELGPAHSLLVKVLLGSRALQSTISTCQASAMGAQAGCLQTMLGKGQGSVIMTHNDQV